MLLEGCSLRCDAWGWTGSGNRDYCFTVIFCEYSCPTSSSRSGWLLFVLEWLRVEEASFLLTMCLCSRGEDSLGPAERFDP